MKKHRRTGTPSKASRRKQEKRRRRSKQKAKLSRMARNGTVPKLFPSAYQSQPSTSELAKKETEKPKPEPKQEATKSQKSFLGSMMSKVLGRRGS